MKIDKTEREARDEFYQNYDRASVQTEGLRAEGLLAFLESNAPGAFAIGLSPATGSAARTAMPAMEDYRAPIWRAVKAALDLEFKPEEPQLPKRLSIVTGEIAWADSSPWPKKKEDVYREAVACYNAARRFTAGQGRPIFERILAEEREKLAKEPS